ncbi:hypothetical protein QAD02_016694 [Eretmocerus hayati]|uniref:Uncharacterized protein n=1 Tax=Eretmocerus hayati TaxID=131215 RepID=A0ACC2PEM3_9HYME|nr:hypothetical protein QAD02_016694 [Eretmocerus hayati]
MSFIRLSLQVLGNVGRSGLQRVIAARGISQSLVHYSEAERQQEEQSLEDQQDSNRVNVPPEADRSKPIPVETSILYLSSDAYKETYGDDPIWTRYRRNYKGQFRPLKTRKTCIRNLMIVTSNPCPICRDEYLVLDHRNTGLLHQFISPFNGEIIDSDKTGLCQKQHFKLRVAIYRAKDFGTISFDVPFREYDYSDWYNPENSAEENKD